MLIYFGNNPFIRHQDRVFPSYVLDKSYSDEEKDFEKIVLETPLTDVPNDGNIIASHTVYKIKINDNHTLKL